MNSDLFCETVILDQDKESPDDHPIPRSKQRGITDAPPRLAAGRRFFISKPTQGAGNLTQLRLNTKPQKYKDFLKLRDLRVFRG
jgi:hypothetical protein